MRLTDEELRDVLARAEEIERAARRGDAWNAELAAVIEEVGLSRQAVEQALTERLNLPATPPALGSLTWARSADGKFYVAQVLSISEEGAAGGARGRDAARRQCRGRRADWLDHHGAADALKRAARVDYETARSRI